MISVVIPTLNRGDLLAGCLASLPDVDVIVVDEGLPFAEQCNIGATRCAGDLVFLNDDTIVHDGAFEALTAGFAHAPVVGARLLYPDGSIQHSGVYLDSPGGVLTAHNRQTDAPSRYVKAVTGACLAVTRECWDELEGFDAGFVNGYEDVDFCLRAGKCWYERTAVVTHLESQSGEARWANVRENVQRLQERWA